MDITRILDFQMLAVKGSDFSSTKEGLSVSNVFEEVKCTSDDQSVGCGQNLSDRSSDPFPILPSTQLGYVF